MRFCHAASIHHSDFTLNVCDSQGNNVSLCSVEQITLAVRQNYMYINAYTVITVSSLGDLRLAAIALAKNSYLYYPLFPLTHILLVQ